MLLNNYEISLKFFRTFDETVFNIKSNKDKYKVAQRVLSFKKKTSLTVMNIHSKLLNNQSVHPPLSAGGGRNSNQIFKKGEALDRNSTFKRSLLAKRGWLYSGRLQFSRKNKSKSEIFNGKKVYEQKYFSRS